MHHKRKKCKNARAGCLMCKPNKVNGMGKLKLHTYTSGTGFGKLRALYFAEKELKEEVKNVHI